MLLFAIFGGIQVLRNAMGWVYYLKSLITEMHPRTLLTRLTVFDNTPSTRGLFR